METSQTKNPQETGFRDFKMADKKKKWKIFLLVFGVYLIISSFTAFISLWREDWPVVAVNPLILFRLFAGGCSGQAIFLQPFLMV